MTGVQTCALPILRNTMCITFFYINTHKNKKWKKNVKFFIAFNRDEDAERQTLPFGAF